MAQQPDPADARFPSHWFPHTLRGVSKASQREWALPSGVKLFGTPMIDGSKVEMRCKSDQMPSVVYLSLSDLSQEDQQAIASELPQVDQRFRRFALYQGAQVTPKWAGAQPKFPGRFVLAVHEDKEHVYFSSAESLILVDKSAFTSESLKEVVEAVSKVRHQLQLTTDRNALRIVGVPIQLRWQDLVMEVKQADTFSDAKFLQGMRYVVSRQYLSPEQEEICKQVATDVADLAKDPSRTNAADPAKDPQQTALPRLCRTTRGPRFVLPRSASRPDEILAGEQPDQARPIEASEISCSDFILWANSGENRTASDTTTTDGQAIPSDVLTALVDGIDKRTFWIQKDGLPYRGKLSGPAADGFIFDNPGIGKCFVPAAQLNEMDAIIALTASQNTPPNTMLTKEDDLKSIFARRVLREGSVVIVREEVVNLNSAVIGEYPVTAYAGLRDGRFTPNRLSDLVMLRNADAWLKENAAILSMGDKPAALQKLASKYPLNLKAAPTKLQPNRQVQKWRLAKSNSEFEAVLVGQLEADYVFESKFGNQSKTYLVAKQALDTTSLAEAEKLASRLETKDWTSEVTRHANWQCYRIWADPQGVLRTPPGPVVVVSISEALIIFESIAGNRISEPMPRDAARQRAAIDLYGAALRSGERQRQAAEADLTLWTFQDAEPTVRAELIGVAPESILVRDVSGREFLINKSTLSADSRNNFESLARVTSDMRVLDATASWSTPRVWCTRTEVVGPAVPEYLTDNDKQLIIRTPTGERQSLKLEDLTLREQLSFLAAWRIKSNELAPRKDWPVADSLKTVDAWLTADVPAAAVITNTPALEPSIAVRIKEVFDKWQHAPWPSTPIKLPKDSNLLAISADATAGVVEMTSGWSVVDFASGQSQPLRQTPPTKQVQFGPWMSRDRQTVYWIEGGQARFVEPGATAPQTLVQLAAVSAACQSGDFESLVVVSNDNSLSRVQLASKQVETLASSEKIGSQTGPIRLWASHDGQSVLLGRGSQNQLFVSAHGDRPELSAFLGTQQATAVAAVGKSQAWLSSEATPRGLTRLLGSTMFLLR